MCELLGISSPTMIEVNDYMREFISHSKVHRDGWGLAVFRGGGVSLEKEPVQASRSTYLKQRLTRKIQAKDMIAHIRLATVGYMEYSNCHPFVWDDDSGRTWTLAHNGTLLEADIIAPYLSLQEGTTDSEGVLLHIIDRMDRAMAEKERVLGAHERFRILDDIIARASAGNKLNLLIYDGEQLYVHTNCPKTLYMRRAEGAVWFCTVPLKIGLWKAVPMNRLLAFRNGEQVGEGTMHGNTFIESEHNMELIFQAYAGL